MAIAGAADNLPATRPAARVSSIALVDRWTLTGISPCACTRGGRVIR
jgi:hypothetical protein